MRLEALGRQCPKQRVSSLNSNYVTNQLYLSARQLGLNPSKELWPHLITKSVRWEAYCEGHDKCVLHLHSSSSREVSGELQEGEKHGSLFWGSDGSASGGVNPKGPEA